MKKLLLIDVSNYMYRAHFATPLMTTDAGIPTNALYGFAKMILGLIAQIKPTTVIFALDSKINHKKDANEDYKAGRNPTPETLKTQFPMIHEFINLLKCHNIEIEGYEADDIIASAAVQYKDLYDKIYIASGDKDLLFFINEKTVCIHNKGKIMDEAAIVEKYGIKSNQMEDYLILTGDKVDGIAGLKGIGPKTASKILNEYGSIKELLSQWESIPEKLKSKMNMEALVLSTQMITTHKDLEMVVSHEDQVIKNHPDLMDFLKKYEINSLNGFFH